MTGTDVSRSADLGRSLARAFGRDRPRARAPLAPLTTFKVGGPADWLLEVHDTAELQLALSIAGAANQPVTVLGGGSNVLVGDRGVRGLVIRMRSGAITERPPGAVRADAGVTLNGLVRWTIGRGLAGLEGWAGTPGTVGGALHGNAHFQGRLIGDLVLRAGVISRPGDLATLEAAALAFGYDDSRLQHTGEILLWADFAVERGDPETLRGIARASLAYRKRTQPLAIPSAGCVFRNPDPRYDPLPPDVPASAGALIDRAGLKGATAGAARFSTVHANFLVNTGGATARDVRELIERCKAVVHERFGIALREEIVYVGEF